MNIKHHDGIITDTTLHLFKTPSLPAFISRTLFSGLHTRGKGGCLVFREPCGDETLCCLLHSYFTKVGFCLFYHKGEKKIIFKKSFGKYMSWWLIN